MRSQAFRSVLLALTAVCGLERALAQTYAYVPNQGSDDVTVIDTCTDIVVDTIPVGDGPWGVDSLPDGTRVYVTNLFNDVVSVIDTASGTVVASIPTAAQPTAIAVLPDGSRAYVACQDPGAAAVQVIDLASNTVTATIAMGFRPHGLDIHPDGSRVYVSQTFVNGMNFAVIDTATNTVSSIFQPGGFSLREVVVHPDGNTVWVPAGGSDFTNVIDTATLTVIGTVPSPDQPTNVAFDPTGARAYITNRFDFSVSVVDTSTLAVLTTIPIGDQPGGISMHPSGDRLYVNSAPADTTSVIDVATLTVTETIAVGDLPTGVGRFIVTLANDSPTAVAGMDQSIHGGDTVFLDGSGSFDDTTASNDLIYAWSLTQVPAGSAAAIDFPGSQTPTFVADLLGTYEVSLVVTDEHCAGSLADEVVISSANIAPTADAGSDRIVVAGAVEALDGTASFDPDLDGLTYAWTLTSAPAGSGGFLTGGTTATPSLTTDLEGDYVVSLIVNDGFEDSAAGTVTLTAISGADFAEMEVMVASDALVGLPDEFFDAGGHRESMTNDAAQVVKFLQKGQEDKAREKLERMLSRTDGCALRGSPDPKGKGQPHAADFIDDCTAQLGLYDTLSAALAALDA